MNLADVDLYPHNQETYDKICKAWETKNRVAVVQATGTGKSYLIMKCMSNFMFQQKLILAPSHYILNQIKEKADGGDINTIYITYQKLLVMSDVELYNLKPALIVLDEFHRCGADAWGSKVVNLLDNNTNAKILGTSATPIRYLDKERNMSDELFEGNVVTEISLSDAIVQGILPMPKYISTLFTFDEEINNLKIKIENGYNNKPTRNNLLKEIDQLKRKLEKSKGAESIISKHLGKENIKKFIVFCRNVEHLEEMANIVPYWFSKESNVKVLKTYVGYSNSDNDFEEFRNSNEEGVYLLFAVDMLNEGIHIEDVTGVILLRPTISPNIYYQQIGRAIQSGNMKKIPIIFDFVNNFENIGSNQFYTDIKKSNEIARKYNKRVIDVPTFLIVDEIKEVKNLFKSIEEKINTSWDVWYEKLVEFYNEHGHCNVPRKGTAAPKNTELAYFVKKQREYYNEGKLSEEHIDKLEAINFSWNYYDGLWNSMYDLLLKYKKENGTIDMHYKEEYEGKKLGDWLSRQRIFYRKGKLNKYQIIKLERLGYQWVVDKMDNLRIPPLGYKYEKGKLIPDIKDKTIIKKVFEIIANAENVEIGEEKAREYLKEKGIRKKFSIKN